MKRILSAAVLFVLLVLTVVALNRYEAPEANAVAHPIMNATLKAQ